MERAKPILTQPGSVPSLIHHAPGAPEVTTLPIRSIMNRNQPIFGIAFSTWANPLNQYFDIYYDF